MLICLPTSRELQNTVAIAAIFLFVAAFIFPVQAHDQWIDGQPVPDWVKERCCGAADAHHLRPTEIHVTPTGYKIDGYSKIIPEERLLRSPDGEWWVFYRDLADGSQTPVFCFFGPPQGS